MNEGMKGSALRMIDRTYPHGIDYLWLACDKDHHVGAFITGGAGPVPTAVLQSGHAVAEAVEPDLSTLPRTSAARLLASIPRPDDFIALAERGFFVYDWCDVHRTAGESTHVYECVAAPIVPTSVDVLPDAVAQLSAVVTLNSVSFANAMAIDVRALTVCSEAD